MVTVLKFYTLLSALQSNMAYNRYLMMALEWVKVWKENTRIRVVRNLLEQEAFIQISLDFYLLMAKS
jgi:hypothetical protein